MLNIANERHLKKADGVLSKFMLSILTAVRKMIFSIKVCVTLLDYLKIPQFAILGDLHV
jgi:hypothetical protein